MTLIGVPGFRLDRQDFYRNLTRNFQSESAFGSVDVDVFEKLTLGAEARVTHNRIEGEFESSTTNFVTSFTGGCFTFPPPGGACVGVPDGTFVFDVTAAGIAGVRTPTKDETRITPVGFIRYQIEPGEQVYGRVAVGFRPEDFEPRANPPRAYDSEEVISYEVGYKGGLDIFDGRVSFDLAAYYDRHNNYQQTDVVPDEFTGQPILAIVNVGPAWTTGLEAGLRGGWALWGGRLAVQASASSSYGEIVEGSPAVAPSVALPNGRRATGGKRVPNTRDYQVALATSFLAPLANTGLDWFTNLAITAQGGGHYDPENRRELENFEDFTATLGLGGEGWRLQLFGRNLFNEIYDLQRFRAAGETRGAFRPQNDFVVHSRPRTWGAELSLAW